MPSTSGSLAATTALGLALAGLAGPVRAQENNTLIMARAVDATGQYRDRVPARSQSGPVGRALDPICAPGDDYMLVSGEIGGQLASHVLSVGG